MLNEHASWCCIHNPLRPICTCGFEDEEPATEELEVAEQPVTRRVVIRGGRTVEVSTYPAMETR